VELHVLIFVPVSNIGKTTFLLNGKPWRASFVAQTRPGLMESGRWGEFVPSGMSAGRKSKTSVSQLLQLCISQWGRSAVDAHLCATSLHNGG
jgi:hypothetical protein